MLSWVHFGDLHVTHEDNFESAETLRALVDILNLHVADTVDFAYLPGDNANNGTGEQYGYIIDALNALRARWHAIPGDHDFEPGSLDNFHAALSQEGLPKAVMVNGHRCLFLDVVSEGKGGPDFKLGDTQTRWLEQQLAESATDELRPTVFMHAYPGDLSEGGEPLARAFADAGVLMVDTGHTHYNELLNDGIVIYAATRSTGQIEEDEGRAGFSIATVDGNVVSWRFQRLDDTWPLVVITSPADRRLVTDPHDSRQVPIDVCVVRAKVFGKDVVDVVASVGATRVAMQPVDGETALWEASLPIPADVDTYRLEVHATSTDGQNGTDAIEVLTRDGASARASSVDTVLGTDAHAVGAWPERGLLGTQLGPNKYGHGW